MRAYFNTSMFLSCLLSIVYLLLMRAPFPMASDGNGPDGRAVLAYLVSILAWIVHAHTLVVGLFLYGKNKKATQIAFGILVASALLLSFHAIKAMMR